MWTTWVETRRREVWRQSEEQEERELAEAPSKGRGKAGKKTLGLITDQLQSSRTGLAVRNYRGSESWRTTAEKAQDTCTACVLQPDRSRASLKTTW